MSWKDCRALKIHCPVSRLAGPDRTNEEKVKGEMYIVLAPASTVFHCLMGISRSV